MSALALGALGVVFGDIGTSPLYAVQAVFSRGAARPVPVSPDDVYGVISLVFWAVTIIVTLKYVVLIMSADNDGEGGIMALVALLSRLRGPKTPGRRAAVVLAGLGIFGASLFFGDGILTPAISVLSAVEGLRIVAPSLGDVVVPVTAVILIGLFMVQRVGTAAVGRWFGPVMVVWFTALAACGVKGIVEHPGVLRALSPTYALRFLDSRGLTAFLALGGVVLAVTGAEALYADMGHFGASPIRRAWLLAVFPALTLNYLGQGALLINEPHAAADPFFVLAPDWARIPMVLLATVATVIASQAVITGAFSVTRQAVQLGYLPRMRIRQTSRQEVGQIYIPLINWALLVGVLALVFAFEHSSNLAAAYGIAVTGTITITTILYFFVLRARSQRPAWQIAAAALAFLIVDLAFLTANLTKILDGGWIPVLVGVGAFAVLMTWQRGRIIVTGTRERQQGPLQNFVNELHEHRPPVARVPGTAVFLSSGARTTPAALRANVAHNHSLHDHAVVLCIETLPVPHVAAEGRLQVSDLSFRDDGISQVTARFGFDDDPNVPQVLRDANARGLESPLEIDEASYFLSKIELRRSNAPGMSRWRKRLFVATSHMTADPVESFGLPRERTIVIGSYLEF
ncbi:MAG: potassium transporter Kup [Solirubrobacteraceae bacterium]